MNDNDSLKQIMEFQKRLSKLEAKVDKLEKFLEKMIIGTTKVLKGKKP